MIKKLYEYFLVNVQNLLLSHQLLEWFSICVGLPQIYKTVRILVVKLRNALLAQRTSALIRRRIALFRLSHKLLLFHWFHNLGFHRFSLFKIKNLLTWVGFYRDLLSEYWLRVLVGTFLLWTKTKIRDAGSISYKLLKCFLSKDWDLFFQSSSILLSRVGFSSIIEFVACYQKVCPTWHRACDFTSMLFDERFYFLSCGGLKAA